MAEHLDWSSPTQVGSHAIARCFLRDGARLLWLTSACTPAHLLFANSKAPRKLERWRSGGWEEAEPGISVYSPMTLLPAAKAPILNTRWAAGNSMRFTVPRLAKWLISHKWDKVDLLWITNPLYVRLLDWVEYHKCAYRIADMTAAYSRVTPAFQHVEEEVIQRVDRVFVANEAMVEHVRRLNSRASYLPNGVEVEVFESADPPKEYDGIPRPRAVYVGALDERVDVGLLQYLAQSLPEVHFCMIGPVSTDLSAIVGSQNVHLLGCVDQSRLAGYLRHSDLGIIPFIRSELTEHVNPLKLLQYMACGLPVVSTDLQETRRMRSPAVLASDRSEFADAVRRCLADNPDREKHRDYATENSWSSRYALIKATLGDINHVPAPPDMGARP